MQGIWVLSLVRELGSHIPRGNEACTPQLQNPHSQREAQARSRDLTQPDKQINKIHIKHQGEADNSLLTRSMAVITLSLLPSDTDSGILSFRMVRK